MTTTTKFTPGPWEYKDSSGAGKGIWANVKPVMGDKFTDIVQVWAWDSLAPPKFQIAYERWVQFPRQDWDEMQEANGRLIAASPTLLMALEFLLEQAEGFNVSGVYFNEFRENRDAIDTANNAIALATGAT